MGALPAYRVEVGSIDGMSALVAGFRADALRVLNRRYHRAVADEAARLVDEHRIGIHPQAGGKGPLRDAVADVRRVFEESFTDPVAAVDFDCEVRFLFVGGVVLARFEHGNEDYLRLFSSISEVRPYDWSATGPRPAAVTAAEWKERGALWEQADAVPKLGLGLSFRLVDGPLPAPKWQAIRRVIPDFESRARRCARVVAWHEKAGTAAPSTPREAMDFKAWLKTREGTLAYDRARMRTLQAIPREIGRDELASYPKVVPRKKAVESSVPDAARPVDHADIYEAADGTVFVMIYDAGLKPEERLYLHLSGDQISFDQGGIHYGSVQRVPHAASDLLRSAKDATVVEVTKFGDRREVKAKHLAIVRSTSISDGLGDAMTRWKNTAAPKPAKEEA